MAETLRALAETRNADTAHASEDRELAAGIAECDRKITQYRAALDSGANPAIVAGWIAETEAQNQTQRSSVSSA
jgi:site-specific DNA recombinase